MADFSHKLHPSHKSHIWIDHSDFEVYLNNVSQDRSLIFWARLTAVAFVTTGPLLHADGPPSASNGDKIVPVNVGGRIVPIKVREGGDPYKNVSSSNSTGRYDPERIFSTESSMANKQFSLPSNAMSQSNSDLKNRDQDTFITKAYVDDASSPADAKAKFPTTSAYSRNATGFDKNYPTSTADDGQSRTALPPSSTASADQNRAAVLGGPEKTEALASNSMANKQYLGPGAQHVPDDIAIRDNVVISRLTGLPNRPLTIDEVRNLINHETKPNTDVKPEESSKPLNDPGYKPEPLRDTPSPKSDDDNDPVPPPGTMSAPPAPENSEPLPQP